jgi:hypothetical protein
MRLNQSCDSRRNQGDEHSVRTEEYLSVAARGDCLGAARAPYAERIESSGRVERVRMVKNSIRELIVDGVFRAHYHDRDHALAAEALAKLSLS